MRQSGYWYVHTILTKTTFQIIWWISAIIDMNSSRYDKYLFIGDFNLETSETALRNFCYLCKLKNLVSELTCLNNPDNLSCIDLFLTNCWRNFQDIQIIETGLSDFHKMNLRVLKMYFTKQKQEFSTEIIKNLII